MQQQIRRGAAIVALTTAATVTAGAFAAVAPAYADDIDDPGVFTSMYTVSATPDMVIDADGEPAPGEEGAQGTFDFRINSDREIICYEIEFTDVTTPYESPARTATHIHEAAAGAAGPPRLAFPDPEDSGDGVLRSEGCMAGPFTTGIEDDDGNDTGEGFSLAQIEADPAAFFADTHTADFPSGAIRGQLTPVPMGGMDTGAGGADAAQPARDAGLVAAGLLALAAVGVAVGRRARR